MDAHANSFSSDLLAGEDDPGGGYDTDYEIALNRYIVDQCDFSQVLYPGSCVVRYVS